MLKSSLCISFHSFQLEVCHDPHSLWVATTNSTINNWVRHLYLGIYTSIDHQNVAIVTSYKFCWYHTRDLRRSMIRGAFEWFELMMTMTDFNIVSVLPYLIPIGVIMVHFSTYARMSSIRRHAQVRWESMRALCYKKLFRERQHYKKSLS